MVSERQIIDLVERYGLNILRFKFTADNGEEIARGQGVPAGNNIIPIEELQQFIGDYSLVGFQSLDVEIDAAFLEALISEESILVLDIASFLFMNDIGISMDDFAEVEFHTEDASWYLSYFFTI